VVLESHQHRTLFIHSQRTKRIIGSVYIPDTCIVYLIPSVNYPAMSLSRVALVTVQAICYQVALTPPNPTPSKGRYHTQQLYILQIAPLIFKVSWTPSPLLLFSLYPLQIQQFITWGWAIFEVLYYLRVVVPITSPTPFVTSIICLPPQPNIRLTPSFIIGVIAVILGTYIRLDCFKTLGQLFTFDLTIHPEHKLITSRFYAYVRHPAYTGSLLLVFGLAFSHLTRGSWMRECGPLRASSSAIVVWALWWLWTLSVGISRADAEDKQMRKLFPEEWDAYAAAVHWWFFPGLI
jgi:protein-S-isoprenylcysteine O-methyltransferase Ste14